MIVKILSGGKSFSGLATYLIHDPEAKTKERVGWTHTLNCAHDEIPSAINEMVWTARDAELLKQEAGIRAGGRANENPVKHLSLNWAPEDKPTRGHMIESAEQFLRHMSWEEHQAILVAHDDKEYSHVHVMLNTVHPETGLKLDDGFERRRAQAWALEYEWAQGRIYCEQRLNNPADREDSPTRAMWLAFENSRKEFEFREKILENQNPIFMEEADKSKFAHATEWKSLKDIQKAERQNFFADGKSEFSEIRNSAFREIREEFRDRWADYYAAKKNGTDFDELTRIKSELVAEQRAALDERRDAACLELRQSRDGIYREILDDQRDVRKDLRERQAAGLDNGEFIGRVRDGSADRRVVDQFRETGDTMTGARATARPWEMDNDALQGAARQERTGIKSGTDIGTNVAEGLGFGLISLLESIADGVVGSTPAARPTRPEPDRPEPNPFDEVIDAARQRQQQEKEVADDEWRKRQRVHGE